jgi:hypothetical protein
MDGKPRPLPGSSQSAAPGGRRRRRVGWRLRYGLGLRIGWRNGRGGLGWLRRLGLRLRLAPHVPYGCGRGDHRRHLHSRLHVRDGHRSGITRSLAVNSDATELVQAVPWTSWTARRSPDPSPPRRADDRYAHRVPGAIATHHGVLTRCPRRRFDSLSWPLPSEPVPCSRFWTRSPPRCPRNVPAPAGLL